MNGTILCVGKLREKWQREGCQEYLKRENEKAKRVETTKDCRRGCNGCGLHTWNVCDWVKNPPLKDTDKMAAPLFD